MKNDKAHLSVYGGVGEWEEAVAVEGTHVRPIPHQHHHHLLSRFQHANKTKKQNTGIQDREKPLENQDT